jgi:hypothetical protein
VRTVLPTLGLPELLDETHGLALETTVEPAAGTGVDEVAEFLRAEVEEPAHRSEYRHHLYMFPSAFDELRGSEDVLVEVNTTVAELAERPLRLKGC